MDKIFGIYDGTLRIGEIETALDGMKSSFKLQEEATLKQTSCFGVGKIKGDILFNEKTEEGVVLSGRILNYPKKGILEEILDSYERSGIDFVRGLEGVFCFVLFSLKEDKITVVSDRYGMKPLYVYHDLKKLIFASEVKAIAKSGLIRKKINWESWRDLFQFGYVMGDKTHFEGIARMPNGSILTYEDNRARMKKYWDYDEIELKERKEEDLILEGSRVLRQAIIKQTKGIERMQILLSGGKDSRAIVAGLKKYTDVDFDTITSPLHASGKMDVIYAKQVADKLDVEHYVSQGTENVYRKYFIELVDCLDFLSFEHLWRMPLSEDLAGFDNIDGIGGDVILEGPVPLVFDSWNMETDEVLGSALICSKVTRGYVHINRFFQEDVSGQLKFSESSIIRELEKTGSKAHRFTEFALKNRTRNSISLAPNNILATNMESLYVFLDKDVVEFALSVPPRMKRHKKLYHKILQYSFPEVMGIPTTKKKGVYRRLKKGFREFKLKLLAKLRFLVLIRASNKGEKGFFQGLKTNRDDLNYLVSLVNEIEIPDMINKELLFRQIEEETSTQGDPTYFLVPMLSFCLWHNMYFRD